MIERGYRETTLTQIIARAGGSKETIYRTLGGKSGIFKAIVAGAGERIAASLLAPDWIDLPPREALIRLGDALATIWHSDEGQAVHRVVLSEGLHSPELVEAWYQGGSAILIDALSQYLRLQVAAGHLKPHDPAVVARQYIILLMGELAFPFVSGEDRAEPSAVHVQRCVDLMLLAHGI